MGDQIAIAVLAVFLIGFLSGFGACMHLLLTGLKELSDQGRIMVNREAKQKRLTKASEMIR